MFGWILQISYYKQQGALNKVKGSAEKDTPFDYLFIIE